MKRKLREWKRQVEGEWKTDDSSVHGDVVHVCKWLGIFISVLWVVQNIATQRGSDVTIEARDLD